MHLYEIWEKRKFTFILHQYQIVCYMKSSMLFGMFDTMFQMTKKINKEYINIYSKAIYIFSKISTMHLLYYIKYLNHEKAHFR